VPDLVSRLARAAALLLAAALPLGARQSPSPRALAATGAPLPGASAAPSAAARPAEPAPDLRALAATCERVRRAAEATARARLQPWGSAPALGNHALGRPVPARLEGTPASRPGPLWHIPVLQFRPAPGAGPGWRLAATVSVDARDGGTSPLRPWPAGVPFPSLASPCR